MKNIITERLILREYKIDDVNDIHEYASNSEVTKYMLFGPNDFDDTKSFVNLIVNTYYKSSPIRNYEYAIEYQSKVIGGISIHLNTDFTECEIGWILNNKYHKKGIMFEAAMALKEHIRQTFNIKRIFATCDQNNIASYKLMEKLGLEYLNTAKNVEFIKKGKLHYRDELMYEEIY